VVDDIRYIYGNAFEEYLPVYLNLLHFRGFNKYRANLIIEAISTHSRLEFSKYNSKKDEIILDFLSENVTEKNTLPRFAKLQQLNEIYLRLTRG
jgi:hypothetical protein